MDDLISRQAAIDALEREKSLVERPITETRWFDLGLGKAQDVLSELPPAQQWIPVSERLPKELEAVNVTWVNHEPEPYYESIKDVPFTASAVYYRGKWYWYSSITEEVLAEYGRYDSEEFDEAIECIAWMPLPKPYKEGEQDG